MPVAFVPPRTVTLRGQSYAVAFPSWRDPRLHLAATITSLQILGQTVFGFELSIAQILISLLTCALIEVGVNFVVHKLIAWPASALLTGNGIAFLLRVNGTRHGDWWSTKGGGIFAGTAALSVASKHVIRVKDRPLFNPSNLGLLLCFLILGSDRVNPLDLWWGNHSSAMTAAYCIILFGGVVIITRVGMVATSLAFATTFALGSALVAQQGHCFTARWHVGPVCGAAYEQRLVLSPEILIFLFFMITDPKTAPLGRAARVAYGSLVGFAATALAATQRTEFGTKVAVLGALTLLCALRPLIEWLLPAAGSADDRFTAWLSRTRSGTSHLRGAARLVTALAVCASILIAVASPRDTQPAVAAANAEGPQIDPATIAHLPPVQIDPAVYRLDASVTDDTATAMAHDLLVALETVARAGERGDVRLARELLTPRELVRLREEQQDNPGTVPQRHDFEQLTIVVVRDSAGFQAGPRLAVRGIGRYVATGALFDRTFMLARQDGRYLLDGQVDTSEIRLD